MSESKEEGSALVNVAFGPDLATVAFYYTFDQGEADAEAGESFGVVKSLEVEKEAVGVGGVEAGAVVADEVDGLAAPLRDAEFDLGVFAFGGEFPGVADEVVEHDLDELGIAGDEGVLGDGAVDGAVGVLDSVDR